MKMEFCLSHFTFCLMVNHYEFVTDSRRTLVGVGWKSKHWMYPDPLRMVTYN